MAKTVKFEGARLRNSEILTLPHLTGKAAGLRPDIIFSAGTARRWHDLFGMFRGNRENLEEGERWLTASVWSIHLLAPVKQLLDHKYVHVA